MARALRDDREYKGCEIVIEQPDGRRATVLAHASPIRDERGRLIGAINILVDITDRKRAEEERAGRIADLTRLHAMSGRHSAELELQPILDTILHSAAAPRRNGPGVTERSASRFWTRFALRPTLDLVPNQRKDSDVQHTTTQHCATKAW